MKWILNLDNIYFMNILYLWITDNYIDQGDTFSTGCPVQAVQRGSVAIFHFGDT